jgi:hypothetical protein
MNDVAVMTYDQAETALLCVGADVAVASEGGRLVALKNSVHKLRPFLDEGFLNDTEVRTTIWDVVERYKIAKPGSLEEQLVDDLIQETVAPPSLREPAPGSAPPGTLICTASPSRTENAAATAAASSAASFVP